LKIKYLGHASFQITSEKGVKIITDPYTPAGGIKHAPIKESADIVTVSHEHGDHNFTKSVQGNPVVLRDNGEANGIKVKAVPAEHDDQGGSQRGKNMIFCFAIDGINVCHMGDLGHMLTAAQVKAIGKADVIMIPVGGFFTIDAATAGKVADQLKPAVIIPMHYKTDKTPEFPISGVDDFLKGKVNVSRINGSEVELTPGKLPQAPQIVVLKAAL
jgi:L-ascorbate metabolism protein UlaG (beta-lactamase superfamily)